jgi:DHA1 family multidrug resistance protein-like MFS transporter
MMVSGTALLFLIFFLPETSAANILTRRARRLRRATGNTDLKTEAEIQSAETSPKDIAFEALARPFILNLEPIVFFCNL